jgi:hypothetical protein
MYPVVASKYVVNWSWVWIHTAHTVVYLYDGVWQCAAEIRCIGNVVPSVTKQRPSRQEKQHSRRPRYRRRA